MVKHHSAFAWERMANEPSSASHSGMGALSTCVLIAGCAVQGHSTIPQAAAQNGAERNAALPGPKPTGKGLLFVASINDSLIIDFKGEIKRDFDLQATNLCSTKQGYVIIPQANRVIVFGHLGNTVRILNAGNDPRSCASDPLTDNVAVLGQLSSNTGEIALFHGDPRGKAKFLQDKLITTYGQCGYDDAGDLFFGGTDASGKGYVAEMPSGSTQFVNYPIAAGLDPFGSLQWDGTYMTITNPTAHTISRLTFAGSTMSIAGTTHISGWNNVYDGKWPYVQTAIVKGQFIAEVAKGTLGYWAYPAGTQPVTKSARFWTHAEHIFGMAYSIPTP